VGGARHRVPHGAAPHGRRREGALTAGGRLHLVADGKEIARRRALVPKGRIVEAWADLHVPGVFWLGDESKTLLDAAGEPLPAQISLPIQSIAVYYGPKLCDIESLPREESLMTRVVSAHGIAAAWITLDRFGERVSYEPKGPGDPIFHLRRPGGGAGHLWRLYPTKRDAVADLTERYGADSEAVEWAQALHIESWDALVRRYASS
jgi:hypothetical protein